MNLTKLASSVGMLFIPCVDGISHNTKEAINFKDAVAATKILTNALNKTFKRGVVMDKIANLALSLKEDMIKDRRYFHSHPRNWLVDPFLRLRFWQKGLAS